MCWSFEASIVTWIISLVTGIYLLMRRNKNDIILGILILTYSSMQLWESLMWLDQKCEGVNKYATKAAYYALWSHLLAIGIGIYIEYKNPIVMVLGLVALIMARVLEPRVFNCSVKGKNGHLVWGFDPKFYIGVFVAAIICLLLFIRPMKLSIIISSLFILSFLFSLIFGGYENKTTGSFWCWICGIFCFIFIYVNSDRPFTVSYKG